MFQIDIQSVPNARLAAAIHAPNQIRPLGEGVFAKVYTNGLDEVIKISSGDEPDWGYLTYLEEIQKAPSGNTWLPEIRDVKVYMDDWDNMALVVRMERLHPVKYWHDDVADDLRAIRNAARTAARDDDRLPHTMNTGEARAAQEAIEVIRRAAAASNHCLDLHDGNFMQRPDGTIVITDPLGFSRTETSAWPETTN